MLNILIVDDMPELKVLNAINYLKSKHLPFKYKLTKCSINALKYLNTTSEKIDLAIIDLGLPFYESGDDYDSLEGLTVVDELFRLKFNTTVIINSETEIPSEKQYFQNFESCLKQIVHIQKLEGKWLYEFIKNLK